MHACRLSISLNALRANFRLAQNLTPGTKLAAVVKADAYGHGARQCAQALNEAADAFAVARLPEAIELREAGLSKPIILLEGQLEQSELQLAAENNFCLMLHTPEQVQQVCDWKGKPGELTVWLKMDTGMHRLGLTAQQCSQAVAQLHRKVTLGQDIVLASHFSCSDTDDPAETERQTQVLDHWNQAHELPVSLANSAAILQHPATHRQWARPGIMLYGSSPLETGNEHSRALQPVMSFQSRVIAVRQISRGDGVGYGLSWRADCDSLVATVAAGYGDGYPRTARSGTPVMINGQRATLCGRVSMDMICVDVSDLNDVEIGSPVELWGEQLSVNEVAACSDTLGYELLTRMPGRAQRVFLD